MLEQFIQIPGPIFLSIFTLYAGIVSLLVHLYERNDYTSKLRVPEPTSLNPLEIAYLRKGIRGALMFSLFGLERKNALEITPFFSTKLTLIKPLDYQIDKMTEQEKIIYNYIGDSKYYRHLYCRGVLKALDKSLQPVFAKLQQMKLAVDNRVAAHHWKAFIVGFALIEVFGGLKLYFGITRDKPVFFSGHLDDFIRIPFHKNFSPKKG